MLYVSILIGLLLIITTDKLTQALKSSSVWMLLGQVSASLVIIMVGSLEFRYINQIELGILAIPFSLLFLVGFTNVMNVEKSQTPFLLLLPCVSFICLSFSAFVMGDSLVTIAGICASVTILFIVLYGYFSGLALVGRIITSSIGFVMAVLSLALLKISIGMIYIPIFTLALPLALYHVIQNKFTVAQSITISTLVGIIFGVLMFVIPYHDVWYLVVGITVIMVFSQLFRRYRFI